MRESEYADIDLSLMLESRARDKEPRGRHGWPMAEATDPANRGKFYAEQPALDFAEQARLAGREEAEKIFKGKLPLDALIIKVGKRP